MSESRHIYWWTSLAHMPKAHASFYVCPGGSQVAAIIFDDFLGSLKHFLSLPSRSSQPKLYSRTLTRVRQHMSSGLSSNYLSSGISSVRMHHFLPSARKTAHTMAGKRGSRVKTSKEDGAMSKRARRGIDLVRNMPELEHSQSDVNKPKQSNSALFWLTNYSAVRTMGIRILPTVWIASSMCMRRTSKKIWSGAQLLVTHVGR